jgi:ABC-type Mn2+/Zn2+ transport system permease subunit
MSSSWGEESLSTSHVFWYGILLGLLANLLPPWLKAIAFVVALAASGLLFSLDKAHANGSAPILLIVAIGVVVGLYFGRMRGLRQLGEAEYRTRWRNVRGVSLWL